MQFGNHIPTPSNNTQAWSFPFANGWAGSVILIDQDRIDAWPEEYPTQEYLGTYEFCTCVLAVYDPTKGWEEWDEILPVSFVGIEPPFGEELCKGLTEEQVTAHLDALESYDTTVRDSQAS